MRKKLFKVVGFLIVSCLFISLQCTNGYANLVQNPGFEDSLTDWLLYMYPSGYSVTTENPHSGDYCLLFDFPGGAGYYDAALRSDYSIYIEAGVPYLFSFWIREVDTHDTFDSSKTILDPDIWRPGYPSQYVPWIPHTEDWQFVSLLYVFPEGAEAILKFNLHGYATSSEALFCLDDVTLTRVVPAPAGLLLLGSGLLGLLGIRKRFLY